MKASARITRRRAVLADRLHHLPVPALLAFHVNRDHRMGRGHQQQDVENQPENQTKHDQDQVEDRRKRLPVHQQPAYAGRVGLGAGGLTNTETVCSRILSLPMHPFLSDDDVAWVAEQTRAWAERKSPTKA